MIHKYWLMNSNPSRVLVWCLFVAKTVNLLYVLNMEGQHMLLYVNSCLEISGNNCNSRRKFHVCHGSEVYCRCSQRAWFLKLHAFIYFDRIICPKSITQRWVICMDFGFNLLKKGKVEGIKKESVLRFSPSCNRHFYLLQNILSTHGYIWKNDKREHRVCFPVFESLCSNVEWQQDDCSWWKKIWLSSCITRKLLHLFGFSFFFLLCFNVDTELLLHNIKQYIVLITVHHFSNFGFFATWVSTRIESKYPLYHLQ